MVNSFGRVQPEPSGPPPLMLPAVQIPAVLVLDQRAMQQVVDQIREQVAQAVRDGFAIALGEHDPEAAVAFDAAGAAGEAAPGAGQLADLTR